MLGAMEQTIDAAMNMRAKVEAEVNPRPAFSRMRGTGHCRRQVPTPMYREWVQLKLIYDNRT